MKKKLIRTFRPPPMTKDPIVLSVSEQEQVAPVIKALQEKYCRTQFYTENGDNATDIKIKRKEWGGARVSISPEIMENVTKFAEDIYKKLKN